VKGGVTVSVRCVHISSGPGKRQDKVRGHRVTPYDQVKWTPQRALDVRIRAQFQQPADNRGVLPHRCLVDGNPAVLVACIDIGAGIQ